MGVSDTLRKIARTVITTVCPTGKSTTAAIFGATVAAPKVVALPEQPLIQNWLPVVTLQSARANSLPKTLLKFALRTLAKPVGLVRVMV